MLSVIICTYKRGEILRRTLRSLSACTRSAGLDWEVLLLDNSAGREAEPIAREFEGQLPIRYVCETAPGVSNARNRGIAESRGEDIWFLDDDVVLVPSWLASIRLALKANPEFGYFWGRVLAEVDRDKLPDWIRLDDRGPSGHAGTYCDFDYGTDDRPLKSDEAVGGGNLGVRRRLFEKVGGFRSDLCPIGKKHRLGGDTEFGERVSGAGERGFYVGTALVYHYTPADRLVVRYALRWSYHRAWASQHCKAIRFLRKGKFGAAFRLGEIAKNGFRMCLELAPALLLSPFSGKRRRVALWMQVFYRLGRLSACFAPRPDMSLDWPAWCNHHQGAACQS